MDSKNLNFLNTFLAKKNPLNFKETTNFPILCFYFTTSKKESITCLNLLIVKKEFKNFLKSLKKNLLL